MATATPAVKQALAAITCRQPNASTAMRSGAPASVAPSVPMSSANAVAKANCLAGIQCVASFINATNATPAAVPMASRPALAKAADGASANTSVPIAVSTAPPASTTRGPKRSASSPVGICTAT